MPFEARMKYLQKVYMKGYNAYISGYDMQDNPYQEEDSREYWVNGWLNASDHHRFSEEEANDHGLV